ncbi:Lon protease family protein, partial [Escherichia coli]
ARHNHLPAPGADAWPVLIREAARYTGEQETLPLSQQCTQRDDENTAICLMHQTWLQGNVAIKLAQAA